MGAVDDALRADLSRYSLSKEQRNIGLGISVRGSYLDGYKNATRE